MITSLQTLVIWPHLQYNLSHVITFCWWRHEHKLWRQKTFILRIIKNCKWYNCWNHQNCDHIETTFIDSIKVKRIRKNVLKCNLSVFPNIIKIHHFSWKMLMSAKLKGCVTWFTTGPFYNYPHLNLRTAPKRPILNRVKS